MIIFIFINILLIIALLMLNRTYKKRLDEAKEKNNRLKLIEYKFNKSWW